MLKRNIMFRMLTSVLTLFLAISTVGAIPSQAAGVELRMWTWKLFHGPGLEAVAKNFEAKTGIKVTVKAFNPDDAYRTKITTGAQSGELADVISYWSGSSDFWSMAAAGVVLEMTDKVDATWQANFLKGTYEKTSMFPKDGHPSFNECQADPKCAYKSLKVGQSFSVPYVAGAPNFAYANKAILKKAGLDPEKAPATADEWMTMMQTVKAKTGTPGLVTGAKNSDVLDFWLFRPLLMTSCGQKVYDDIWDNKESFTTACSQNVLNWMEQIQKNDLWMPGLLATDIDPADQAFEQGKAAFDIGGTYTMPGPVAGGRGASNILPFAIPPLKGAKDDKLNISVFPFIETPIAKD